uniref:CSON015583 protein n=1 Tax=Culicoides sonorensis TaxID=179676 RepID=A0A336LPY3_CULSO
MIMKTNIEMHCSDDNFSIFILETRKKTRIAFKKVLAYTKNNHIIRRLRRSRKSYKARCKHKCNNEKSADKASMFTTVITSLAIC